MKPEPRFIGAGPEFWATVRIVGQFAHYTKRGASLVLAHGPQQIREAVRQAGLDASYLKGTGGPTELAEYLSEYLTYRAHVLNSLVEPLLMDLEEAHRVFTELRDKLSPSCPIPNNKQKGEKKGPAYFTGIINMLVEANSQGQEVDYSPRSLTIITDGGRPLRTLGRWMDGCFPAPIDPVAVWEVKEYYYTTTFGSRVADGVYETIMDGMELQELRQYGNRDIKHYLMVDSHYTWWKCGRPYLCRLVDALHMGYVDEVLFGSEVLSRLPSLVGEWVGLLGGRPSL